MANTKSRTELINMLLGDKDSNQLEEEEILHLLLQQKLTKNINKVQSENLTFGAKMADNIARFAGSWTFIISFVTCLVAWIFINTLFLIKPYDAYPFILLNLILSCVAALQAPVIMMSQNRQEEKDRLRSLNDYKTNLKTEIIIEDLHQKLDQMLDTQDKLLQKIDRIEKHINLEK
jgi:uncharacterized membrane protein